MLARLLITTALLLVVAPAAQAAESVRWGHAPDGNPLLTSPGEPGRTLVQWWACSPSEACRAIGPAPDNSYALQDPQLAPGTTARGTYFEGMGFDFDERSPMWMGQVTARNHPRVVGSLRVGRPLVPKGALWSGGWADDTSTLALVACPASARATCEYLLTAQKTVTGPGPRTLGRKHRGWYVYAVDHRVPADGPAPDLRPGPAPRPAATPLLAVSERRGVVRSAS